MVQIAMLLSFSLRQEKQFEIKVRLLSKAMSDFWQDR